MPNDPITLDTLKSLNPGDYIIIPRSIQAKSAVKTDQRWKVSGQVKTWKRDASRVRVPLKFGLYAYDAVSEHDIDMLNAKGATIEKRGY